MQSVHVDHEQRGQSSAASVTTDSQPPIWERLCIFTLNRQLQTREEETKALVLTCDCSAYSNSFTLPSAKKKVIAVEYFNCYIIHGLAWPAAVSSSMQNNVKNKQNAVLITSDICLPVASSCYV